MEHLPVRHAGVKYMLAGGSVVAALGLLVDPRSVLLKPAVPTETCQAMVQPEVILSREQLAQLLSVPEGAGKEQLRQIMPNPYCRLSDLQIRAGSLAQREVYPLAFDPQTWFVVLYEGDRYAGYSFSFRH